ncbi:MAG: transposase [Defluviitaleaceae bacterium]|nr:transposase [Defluviitaleaceae bacterium]
MKKEYRDITDEVWYKIEPLTIGNKGMHGGNAKDTRKFINAVLWILYNKVPWRELPSNYGNWVSTHRRFYNWRDKNIWEDILLCLVENDEYSWLFFNEDYINSNIKDVISIRKKDSKFIFPWLRMIIKSEILVNKLQFVVMKNIMKNF